MHTRNISSTTSKQQPQHQTSRPTSLPLLSKKLVPKHLLINKKNVFSAKKLTYQEPIHDKIKRNQKQILAPLSDIEAIMKKFDEVIESKKSVRNTPRNSTKKRQQMQKKNQSELQKKITNLLSLPSVKKIKQNAQAIRQTTEGANLTNALFTQGQRLTLLSKYEEFIKNSGTICHRKIATEPNSNSVQILQ